MLAWTRCHLPNFTAENRSIVIGISLILLAEVLLSGAHATTKLLAETYGPIQIIFFRALAGLVLLVLLILAKPSTRSLAARRPLLQVVRALAGLFSFSCFVLAYKSMPLSDVIALVYAAPIVVTALSSILLSESVGARKWSAILCGFFGVLLVLQPEMSVSNLGAVYAVAGMLSYSFAMIVTRKLSSLDSTYCTGFYTMALWTLLTALALPFVWVPAGGSDLLMLLLSGLLGSVGIFVFIHAFRFAEASLLAPYSYSAIIWAVLLQLCIWGDVPDSTVVVGILVITISGIYLALKGHDYAK